MLYFEGLATVAEIKAQYRKLAFENHPDLGGDTVTMQEINRQYEQALRGCDGQEGIGSDGRTHTYKWDAEAERGAMDIISALLGLNLPSSIEISLIGTWVWVKGDTKPCKDSIKAVGCNWSKGQSAWYWSPTPYKRRRGSKEDLDTIAARYGKKTYSSDRREYAAIA